ncbi:MAG TPA: CAP domain-containing protein [Acidimicrobiales bacterium]
MGAAPSSQPAPRVTQKDELLDMLNADRAAAGLHPLTLRAGVAQTAREWAAQMARENRLSHHPDLRAALARWGVVGWSAAGENVGVAGHVSQVHHNFMGSPGHRASILNPSFSEVGIGVTASGGQVWVVIDFVG